MSLRSVALPVLLTLLMAGAYLAGAARTGSAPAPSPLPAPAARAPNTLKFDAGAPQLASLRIAVVEEAPLPVAEPLNGRIAYNEDVTGRVSSPVAGRILSLKAAPGDSVKAGQVLATMDAPDLAAAVADLRKAEADESRKRLAQERAQKLFDADVMPRKELESAQADRAAAVAETERARLRLRNLTPGGGADGNGGGNAGGGLALRSPVNGVVADRKANPAMEVQPGMADPLFVVTDIKRLWVLVDLPERYLSKVSEGLAALVTVDGYPGETFRARVVRIGQVMDAGTRRVQIRCDLPNPEGLLKPEMFARVSLLARDERQVLRLPNSALVTEGLFSYVFVETAAGAFARRKVELSVQERDYAYLSGGVNKGERVVVNGALLLQSELGAGS